MTKSKGQGQRKAKADGVGEDVAAVDTTGMEPTGGDQTSVAEPSADDPVDEPIAHPAAPSAEGPRLPRPKPTSKLGIVVGLLERAEGASLTELVAVTGWQPHTTRAALTGLRKRGISVQLDPGSADGPSIYRIRKVEA